MRASAALRAATVATALLAASCASKKPATLYDWGEYQGSVYRMYVKPGEFLPDAEIHKLETQIEDARVHERKVPPGFYAYLAMLCESAGDAPGAAGYLRMEKAAFPESGDFVDGMLARMTK